MAGLGEIVEEIRTDAGDVLKRKDERIHRIRAKRKWLRKRQNSGGSEDAPRTPPESESDYGSIAPSVYARSDETGGWNVRRQENGQGVPPAREDHQARFYEEYRKVAEEYDKEFLKKYDEDLNTTLIFAGLFSAVAAAFVIQVDSQLQPDPGEETAALLRVLIYKIDNTTFGNDVPTLPQWSGPPRAKVQVQIILFASLAASLFSAFLAMLAKQWLNRYASTDVRGTTVERSQNRQRKLDGIVTWYFDYAMELLPLMLQAALLLLGCALSRYLWGIDVTVASVVLCVTSFGVLFYLFIIIAPMASESCPYQTPLLSILRLMVWSALRSVIVPTLYALVSALENAFRRSKVIYNIRNAWWHDPWWSSSNIIPFLRCLVWNPPCAIVVDVYRLGRAVACSLVRPLAGAYHLICRMCAQTRGSSPTSEHRSNQQTISLDLRCVSWTLQTSLDKAIHLPTLKHLAAIPELAPFDPTLVVDCFDIFVGCINVNNEKVVVAQGLEEMATMSARCLFRTLVYVMVTDPNSSVLVDLVRRYNRVFTFWAKFTDHPFRYAMTKIRTLITENRNHLYISWRDDRPSRQELIPLARYMAETAEVGYRRTQRKKVPRWILRFALHFLSQEPPSPTPIIADCLKIIAIDLDCDASNVATSDESIRVEQLSSLITQTLEAIVDTTNPSFVFSKRKGMNALFPYAIRLERNEQQGMTGAISRAAGVSNSGRFMWRCIGPYVTTLFDEPSHPSLNQVLTLASPHIPWDDKLHGKPAVARWLATASAVPYTEEIGQCVIDVLLQIASIRSLRQYIPIEVWAWLKKQPSLPPECRGRVLGVGPDVVRYVRELGDLEILKSYFLLIWSEWERITGDGYGEMEVSIREDFGGIGMHHDREDLLKRLDHVLGQLGRGLGHFRRHKPWMDEDDIQQSKTLYRGLKEVLLEIDQEATEIPP